MLYAKTTAILPRKIIPGLAMLYAKTIVSLSRKILRGSSAMLHAKAQLSLVQADSHSTPLDPHRLPRPLPLGLHSSSPTSCSITLFGTSALLPPNPLLQS